MTKVNGSTYVHPLAPEALNDKLAAERYDAMRHDPYAYGVQLSYLNFKHETLAQFADIVAGGIVPVWDNGDHEYLTSQGMFDDAARGMIYVRHTRWSGDEFDMPEDHPMREHVNGYLEHGRIYPPIMLNDVFRFVHDINGHYGGRDLPHHSFGPNGERSAWRRHRDWYSRAALQALWCETRGQAAWVNAFDNHAELPQKMRPFAAQKSGLVPTWLV